MYIKPTHTNSYLLINSNHPNFITKNIPKSLIIRIRRNCTNLESYFYNCTLLLNNLLKRGYNYKKIIHDIFYIASLDRNNLILYKDKQNNLSNCIPFIYVYDKKLLNFQNNLSSIWMNTLSKDSLLKNLLFKVFYRVQPNLNSVLINKISYPFNSFKYYKCNNINCKICKYANTDSILYNKLNLPILIPCNTTCNSKNCIYIILCKKCNVFYVGETGRTITARMAEHIYRIKYYSKIINDSELSKKFFNNNTDSFYIYKHFSLNHEIDLDFSFQIFIKDLVHYRERLESDLIYILDCLYPYGLNSKNNYKLNSLNNYYNPPLK